MKNIIPASDLKGFSILETVEKYGIQFKRAGSGRHVARCPFHEERTASFFVFESTNRFKCFGCGIHGDPIDFVRNMTGCSFIEAFRQLSGRSDVQWFKPDPGRDQAKQLVEQFRKWEADYSEILCQWCSVAYQNLFACCKPGSWTNHSDLIRAVAVAQNHLDVLALGSDHHKYELYRAIKSGNGGSYV